ncbi:hypothetical protein O5623_19250 [Escherichia coli]|nr:hypothetical protein [Escherichia coli]
MARRFIFPREALLRALKTGHNEIFLSSKSKTQAYVFPRRYIIAFTRLIDGAVYR